MSVHDDFVEQSMSSPMPAVGNDLNLKPVQSSNSAGKRPALAKSDLAPWTFEFLPSSNGQDENLLIMFHGLGDTCQSFYNLAKQLRLPSTAVISLQASDQIALLEEPAFSWYHTFDPLFNPLPNPSPAKPIPRLRKLLETLISKHQWDLHRIHLFGWGQGGTMVLELALDIGKTGITSPSQSTPLRRLGSCTTVCGPLISHPNQSLELTTPVLYFHRNSPQAASTKTLTSVVQKAFKEVTLVARPPGHGGNKEAMPGDRDDWAPIMKFWADVLSRDESWKGEGEVYEVVR